MAEELDFSVTGMTCGGCVTALRNVLRRIDGVEKAEVELGRVKVVLDPNRASAAQIHAAVARAGFGVGP